MNINASEDLRNELHARLFSRGLFQIIMPNSLYPESQIKGNDRKSGYLQYIADTDRAVSSVPYSVIWDVHGMAGEGVLSNLDDLVEVAREIGANSYTLGKELDLGRNVILPLNFYSSRRAKK